MNNPILYLKGNHLQRRGADEFSVEFKKEFWEMSGRCIDIGSGPGDAIVDFILPKLNPKATIICSDISEAMVEYGKKKYSDIDRLSFIKLDIETRDLAKDLIEQFDHVTSFYCFQWCQDMHQVFENIFNLLRPGGTSFVTFVGKLPTIEAYKVLAAMPQYQPYMKDADSFIPFFQHGDRKLETLRSLLEDIGFQIGHCSLRKRSHIFITPDDLGKVMLPVNPFIDRMPANLKNEYKKDLIKECARQNVIFNENNEDEYSVLFTYYAFVLYLRKPLTK